MVYNDTQLSFKYIYDTVDIAFETRCNTPWGKLVPFSIFLEYVVSYSNVDERRDEWRPLFHSKLMPLVQDHSCNTAAEVTVLLNQKIWSLFGGIVFKSQQTPMIMRYSILFMSNVTCCRYIFQLKFYIYILALSQERLYSTNSYKFFLILLF